MKKVLVITYYWPPSGGAGVQRWLKFVKYLPQFGWEPIVLTVNPEHASYPFLDPTFEKEVSAGTRVIRTRSREIFSVYKSVYRSEKIPSAGFSNVNPNAISQRFARFVRGHFFIPDPRRAWNKYAIRAAEKLISEEKIDCIITSSPPHSTQLIGRRLSQTYSIPWIADFRDPWTDIFYHRQLYPSLLSRLLNLRLEKRIFHDADQIITVGPSLKNIFLEKHQLSEEQVKVVFNGFDEDDFRQLPRPSGQHFTITYVGTLSDLYPIHSLVKTMLELIKHHPHLRLRFIGSVSVNHRQVLKQFRNDNIELLPHVSHREALEYMSASNVLLLVIPDHVSGKGILTGKLFEYLATGNRILGIGPPDGDSAAILEETGQGIMIDYNDDEGLRLAIEKDITRIKNPDSDRINDLCMPYSRKNLSGNLARIMNELIQHT